MYIHVHENIYYNSLGCEQPPGLDVNQSLIAQDLFWPSALYVCMHVHMYMSICLHVGTIEYEAELHHKNEMARVEAEISGK